MGMPKPIRRKSRKRNESQLWWFRGRVPDDGQKILSKREWWVFARNRRMAERAILKHVVETDQVVNDIRSGSYWRFSNDDLEHIAMSWGIDFRIQWAAHESLPPSNPTQVVTDEPYGPISSEAELDEFIQKYLDRIDWADLGPKRF